MYPYEPLSNPYFLDFAYCQDDATQVIYIHGDGSDLANMDIDCDGLQSPRPDDRCGSSDDTQSETSFKDLVAEYLGGGSSGSDDNDNKKRSLSRLNVKRNLALRERSHHHHKSKSHSTKTQTDSDPDPTSTQSPDSDSTQSPNPTATQSPDPSTATESAPGSEPTQAPPNPGTPVSDLNANYIPYVVFGNDGSASGFTTFDPTQYGIQPLSVMAVVCNDQLVSSGILCSKNPNISPLSSSTVSGAIPMVTTAHLWLERQALHWQQLVSAQTVSVEIRHMTPTMFFILLSLVAWMTQWSKLPLGVQRILTTLKMRLHLLETSWSQLFLSAWRMYIF
jgi:hypothetical protein